MIRALSKAWWSLFTAAITVAMFHAIQEIERRIEAQQASEYCDHQGMLSKHTPTGWACLDEAGREWR